MLELNINFFHNHISLLGICRFACCTDLNQLLMHEALGTMPVVSVSYFCLCFEVYCAIILEIHSRKVRTFSEAEEFRRILTF